MSQDKSAAISSKGKSGCNKGRKAAGGSVSNADIQTAGAAGEVNKDTRSRQRTVGQGYISCGEKQ